MILTYEDYLPAPGSLTLEEMQSLHREIKEDAGHDEDALGLYQDLLAAAVKYSESRACRYGTGGRNWRRIPCGLPAMTGASTASTSLRDT